MMHANKMILVPHEMVGDQQDTPTKKFMSILDNEMLKILQDDSIADDLKIVKYNQVLQRYKGLKQEQDKPFQLEIKETQLPKREAKVPPPPTPPPASPLHEMIYKTVPQKFHKQADLLLDYAQKNPHLKWSSSGEMIVDNNKIVGSNIIDLVNDFVRSRKIEPAIGANIFMKKLSEANIPREAIINKERLKLMDQEEILATPTKSSPPKQQSDSSERKKVESSIGWKSFFPGRV